MKEKLILLFAAIGLSVIAQNLSQNNHAYISDEEAARLIKADDDLYEYQVHNDTLFINSSDEFFRWPLGDHDTLEGLLTRFENPTVSPFYSERYKTSEGFYLISTPHSETKVTFGQQYDEPVIHSFILEAKISGDVTLDKDIRIGITVKELLEKLNLPFPNNVEKIRAVVIKYRIDDTILVFSIEDTRINRIEILP